MGDQTNASAGGTWQAAATNYSAKFAPPIGDLPLVAVRGGLVIVDTHQIVRWILLPQNTITCVVRVLVSDCVAQLLGALVVPVTQVRRYQSGFSGGHVGHGRAECGDDRT